jgi:hypothetical protein
MNLFSRLIRAIKRNNREKQAASERIEEGRKTGDILPYLGPVVEDDCGVPDGLVGEWKGPA